MKVLKNILLGALVTFVSFVLLVGIALLLAWYQVQWYWALPCCAISIVVWFAFLWAFCTKLETGKWGF